MNILCIGMSTDSSLAHGNYSDDDDFLFTDDFDVAIGDMMMLRYFG